MDEAFKVGDLVKAKPRTIGIVPGALMILEAIDERGAVDLVELSTGGHISGNAVWLDHATPQDAREWGKLAMRRNMLTLDAAVRDAKSLTECTDALRPFASIGADAFDTGDDDDTPVYLLGGADRFEVDGVALTFGQFRRAAALLARLEARR